MPFLKEVLSAWEYDEIEDYYTGMLMYKYYENNDGKAETQQGRGLVNLKDCGEVVRRRHFVLLPIDLVYLVVKHLPIREHPIRVEQVVARVVFQ